MAETEQAPPSAEVPTSPIKERSASLQHLLDKRPDPKDLLERNILHASPTTSPELVKRQHELDLQMKTDHLKHHLQQRPDRKELAQRGIIPKEVIDGTVAPSLLSKQRELEKSMKEDALREKLVHRPDKDEIIKKGILLRMYTPLSPRQVQEY